MSPPLDDQFNWEALGGVARFSSSILQCLQSYQLPVTQPTPSIPSTAHCLIPGLALHIPSEVWNPISNLKISVHIRNTVTEKLTRSFDELQSHYVANYTRTATITLQTTKSMADVHAIHLAYVHLSRTHLLPQIKSQISLVASRISTQTERYRTVMREAKRPFNSQYSSVLETYFELCGYPPTIHRIKLAEKTMMTPRQIEVWFQNHRNRAKKDGITIHRHPTDLALKRALDVFQYERSMSPDQPSDIESGTETVNDLLNSFLPTQNPALPDQQLHSGVKVTDDFINHSLRSSCAFPVPFSQPGHSIHDANYLFTVPPPVWPRKPSTVPIRSTAEIDMDEFSTMFQLKLSFLERRRAIIPSGSSGTQPWFLSTVTIPPRGCHPAHIRGQAISPSKRTPCSTHMPLQLPVGQGQITSNIFEAFAYKHPLAFNSDHSTTSDGDEYSHMSKPPSRTPSFGSDMSSGKNYYSTSNSSSPEPSTPLQLPETDVICNPEEFALEGYNFDALSFMNHPDFNLSMKDILDPHVLHKNHLATTTIDPSLLMYSNSVHLHSSGLQNYP